LVFFSLPSRQEHLCVSSKLLNPCFSTGSLYVSLEVLTAMKN